MGFTAITQAEIAAGQPVTQALMQKVKDNDDYLYSQVGAGGGGGEGGIPNGSFEIDADSDGGPDGWTKNLYPAGGGAIETASPSHGAQAYKFTQQAGPGNGGGYLDMNDYLPCSPVQPLLLEWLHYASVAGMHNLVQIRWFDKVKVYLSTTTVYDSTANPVSWTRKTAFAIPPAGAKFWKIRIIGGYTDTDIAGTAYWDGVSRRSDFVDYPVLKHDSYNAEWISVGPTSYTDVAGSEQLIYIPRGVTQVVFVGQLKTSWFGSPPPIPQAYSRWRVGTTYSNEVDTLSTDYVGTVHVLDVSAVQGTAASLILQLHDINFSFEDTYKALYAYMF